MAFDFLSPSDYQPGPNLSIGIPIQSCHIAKMNFIASLKSGSYTAQMARARSLSMVPLAGLEFTWNGRQYVTGILTDVPVAAQESPQITLSGMAAAPPSTPSLPDPALVKLEGEEAAIEAAIKAEKAKTAKPVVKKAP